MLKLNISQAERWTVCKGSIALEKSLPFIPSEAAEEGTAAAYVFEEIINKREPQEKAPNGFPITQEMKNFAQRYTERSGITDTPETEFPVSIHYKDKLEINGRLDVAFMRDDHNIMVIDDYKYGYTPVEATNNLQLLLYAYYFALSQPQITEYNLGIYQPRVNHPRGVLRRWHVTREQVLDYSSIVLDKFLDFADDMLVTGSHCRFCKAASTCPALTLNVYKCADIIRCDTAHNLTPEQLNDELNFLEFASEIIKSRKAAIEAEATQFIKDGGNLRDYTLSQSEGRYEFTVSPDTFTAITGKSPFKQVLMSKTELVNEYGLSNDIIHSVMSRKKGATKLTKVKGF